MDLNTYRHISEYTEATWQAEKISNTDEFRRLFIPESLHDKFFSMELHSQKECSALLSSLRPED